VKVRFRIDLHEVERQMARGTRGAQLRDGIEHKRLGHLLRVRAGVRVRVRAGSRAGSRARARAKAGRA
jgi:hypothetical protein